MTCRLHRRLLISGRVHDVHTLAEHQGVQPVADFDALLGGWPEDEPADDFLAAVREWRQQNPAEVHAK